MKQNIYERLPFTVCRFIIMTTKLISEEEVQAQVLSLGHSFLAMINLWIKMYYYTK